MEVLPWQNPQERTALEEQEVLLNLILGLTCAVSGSRTANSGNGQRVFNSLG